MVLIMREKWNERYSDYEYVYGKEPNEFLKETFFKNKNWFLEPILMLGDGEGRNGVFLASQNLDVTSLDYSEIGLKKAERLAEENKVVLKTVLSDVNEFDFGVEAWGSIILIYLHLPKIERIKLYEKIKKALKPSGMFLLEVFSIDQLKFNSGGPKDLDLLVCEIELKNFFDEQKERDNFNILLNERKIITLNEGILHQGDASVVRFICKKLK